MNVSNGIDLRGAKRTDTICRHVCTVKRCTPVDHCHLTKLGKSLGRQFQRHVTGDDGFPMSKSIWQYIVSYCKSRPLYEKTVCVSFEDAVKLSLGYSSESSTTNSIDSSRLIALKLKAVLRGGIIRVHKVTSLGTA